MIGFQVQLAPGAESDIADAFGWYKEYSSDTAIRWRARIIEAVEYLGRSPLQQKMSDDGIRVWHVAKTQHSIVYEVNDSVVTVLAVAHSRRAPGYWRKGQS